jgi:hypothetical protein
MVGNVGDSHIVVNLPVTTVPRCIGSNAKTLGLQDCSTCSFLVREGNGRPPDGTCIVHHGTDELLIQQKTIPDGETVSPVQERSQPLCRFLSHLIDMCRLGEPFIKGQPKITGNIDLLDCLPEELY